MRKSRFFISSIGQLMLIVLITVPHFLSAQQYGFGDENDNSQSVVSAPVVIPSNQPAQQIIGLESPINPDEYILGPGDGFNVSIIAQNPMQYQIEVNPTGKLAIPGVGELAAEGKTISEAEEAIFQLVRDQFKNSKVVISFNQIRSISCFVTGAVGSPGKYRVHPIDRVDDLLSEGGGMTRFAYPFAIELIHRDGSKDTLNINKFQQDGELSQNPQLRAGDRIVVPPTDLTKRIVILRTGFSNAGIYPLKPEETLKHFLDHYGKFASYVEIGDIAVFRKGQEYPMLVNIYTEADTFQLESGDEILLNTVKGIVINGFVNSPGRYPYRPDFTISDYVAYAGGVTQTGALRRVTVVHPDGTRESGLDVPIQRGDIIIVPESRTSIWVGNVSILQIVTSVASLVLTYIAATRTIN